MAEDLTKVTSQMAETTIDESSILSFAGQGFKLDKSDDAKLIIDEIIKRKKLSALRLEGNTLGVDAAEAIGAELKRHPEFERALWSDMFTGRMKSEIPQALKHLGNGIMGANAKLVELDLSDNAFGPNGMEGILDLLKSSSCYSLQELRLNNNGLGVFGGRMLADCLLQCHKSSVTAGTPLKLKVFVSGRGRLENEGSIALAEAFKAMGSLQEVSMPQNGIQHKGITALAGAFAECKNLRSLNLNDNIFTEKGAEAMAKALPNMQQLEVINFGDCLLRTKGAEAIAKALKDGHNQLKELIMSYNEVTIKGGQAVVEAIENKPNLVKVELNGNQFGEDGVEIIQGSMEAIDKLDLLGSLSDDEGVDSDEDDDASDEVEDESPDEESKEEKSAPSTPLSDMKAVNASDFLAFPSPTKLHRIEGNIGESIVNHLGDKNHEVFATLEAFMKISSIVTENDIKTQKAASACADAIFNELLSGNEENLGPEFTNELLVHLGLLKGENKMIKAPKTLEGPLILLKHVICQSYFPKSSRDTLQLFLGKPHQLLKSSSKAHQELMTTLHKY